MYLMFGVFGLYEEGSVVKWKENEEVFCDFFLLENMIRRIFWE